MSTAILCAIDVCTPEVDREVLRIAARLADLDGARLDVMTVVPDFGMSAVGQFPDKARQDRALADARQALGDIVSGVLGDAGDRKVRHMVAAGKAYEEILRVAREEGADLIVIGSHRPELRDYLLGPNATRVVRHAECSVYVVRPSA